MKKQFVSLNQALGYLQFLSTDTEAFTDKQFKKIQLPKQQKNPPTPRNKNQISYIQNSQKGNNPLLKQLQSKKNLNKNRAIKRIIDTSKQILQANQNYQQPNQDQPKSYVTQFNIYLKQYNRLCQQILAQEHQKNQKKAQMMAEQQAKLQNVYSFSVEQDFRGLIEVSILKDRINKNNVDMIMDTFKLVMVILKNNQLRIYQDIDQDSAHRDIKVHEIENVDYFSQPYIFTVMTIVKDKSAGSQFLCFRFDCSEKQHKWDRAIYCNYIVRKMKHKSKYFLLEFPDKEAEKRNQEGLQHINKKRDDTKSYDLDRKRIIKSLHNQRDKSKQKQGTRMATMGLESQRDLPTVQRRDSKMQRFNTTDHQNFIAPTRQNNYNMMSTKNADQKPLFETNYKGNKMASNDNSDNRSRQDSLSNGTINRNNTGIKPTPTNQNTSTNKQNPTYPTQTKPNQMQPKQSPSTNRQNKQQNPPPANNNTPNPVTNPTVTQNQQFIMSNQSDKKIINPYTKRKIQLKKMHENGIKVLKIKFFSDKPKLIYLGNQQFQYWNYDETTYHKTQNKLILFKDIKTYKITRQKNMFITLQLANKTLEFSGREQDLYNLVQWIELPKKQRQFQQNSNIIISKGQGANKQPNIFSL